MYFYKSCSFHGSCNRSVLNDLKTKSDFMIIAKVKKINLSTKSRAVCSASIFLLDFKCKPMKSTS